MYVKLYKEKKSVTQSCFPSDKWILEVIPIVDKSFIDETMNWNGTEDSQKQIKLKFDNYDSAVRYAQSKGMKVIDCAIEGTSNSKRMKKNYLKNF